MTPTLVYPWGVAAVPDAQPNLLREMQRGAVDVLREWLGRGEEGKNNWAPRGSWLMRVTHGYTGSWCSAVQWTAENEWCMRRGIHHPIPWRRKVHSARWLLREIASIGGYVEPLDIQVGDYVCLPRGIAPWQAHAQRCSIRHGAGVVSVIDGNVGSYRRTKGRVREVGPIDLRRAELVGIARYY